MNLPDTIRLGFADYESPQRKVLSVIPIAVGHMATLTLTPPSIARVCRLSARALLTARGPVSLRSRTGLSPPGFSSVPIIRSLCPPVWLSHYAVICRYGRRRVYSAARLRTFAASRALLLSPTNCYGGPQRLVSVKLFQHPILKEHIVLSTTVVLGDGPNEFLWAKQAAAALLRPRFSRDCAHPHSAPF